jgi:hypothetical protein
MFEGWGFGEWLFFIWIAGSVITGLVVTWGEKDNDAFYVKFMLCGIIWPLICVYALFFVSRKKW